MIDAMRRDYERGMTLREVGAKYFCDHTTVRKYLLAAGCQMRGERVATVSGGHVVQRFFPLQNALVELVAGADTTSSQPVSDAAFWGVTFVCPDLISGLGDNVSNPRPTVQPGRHIAPATTAAELGTSVAIMTPRTG